MALLGLMLCSIRPLQFDMSATAGLLKEQAVDGVLADCQACLAYGNLRDACECFLVAAGMTFCKLFCGLCSLHASNTPVSL